MLHTKSTVFPKPSADDSDDIVVVIIGGYVHINTSTVFAHSYLVDGCLFILPLAFIVNA